MIMLPYMNMNADTYVAAPTTSQDAITLNTTDTAYTQCSVFNEGTTSVFISSGSGVAAPTITFPASKTVPSLGTVVGPGIFTTFSKNADDKYISTIRSTGTGNVYFTFGKGE